MTDLLNLPFDMYQRYRDVAEIVSALKDGQKLKILDVGGFPGVITDFLSHNNITVLDVYNKSDLPKERTSVNYVKGDGAKLSFDDNSFDLVCSLDTLEHVEASKRDAFLSELARVSKNYVILIAPYFSENNRLAEEITYQFFLSTFKSEFQILKEHLDNGLPQLNEVVSYFSDSGFSKITIPSGYLYNWLPMQVAKMYVQSLNDSEKLHQLLDRFYNQNYYESDHRNPSYRTVIVASKKKDPLDAVQKKFDNLSSAENKNFFNDFSMLLSLLNLKHQEKMEAMVGELERVHIMLKEKDVHITNLEAIIRDKEQHIRNLEEWMAKIQNATPYKVYSKVKGMGRKNNG
ncbi:MAG: class I SAM-dependent methyltransferase [Actinobacteria bacterium]|nr:MAG: class I SAM-dependent methyltransferase [Actinomycetota bacterium]